ncbi:alpha 1,2-mannosyltransferase 2.4.1 [Borealophlyctis nickersoniae]|nr:alpha 1,2-mannosyltransferase 2.4.1 [Borealophlyctis nickersoniae]
MAATRANVSFELIGKEHWGYPDFIDLERARAGRKEMKDAGMPYGGSESYRHMCRWNSGFFFREPAMLKYEYYWRIEPSVDFYCPVTYDPFLFMKLHNLKYGFNVVAEEYAPTVKSLGNATKQFMQQRGTTVFPDHLKAFWDMEVDDFNLVHFWSNFEIADLSFFRSDDYIDYFNFLDQAGGFFYERWGDAPVHSLAAGLFLNLKEMHYFEDIGYRHDDMVHCPVDRPQYGIIRDCACKIDDVKWTNSLAIKNWRKGYESYMNFMEKNWS